MRNKMATTLLKTKETGVALFACLMILLVLSLLGITAMRMMTSQAQVTSGSLGAGISYSAGASVINAAILAGQSDLDTRTILPRVGEAPRVSCLQGASGAAQTMGSCGTGADARGVSTAQVSVSTIDTDADTAAQAQARLTERVQRFGSMPGVQIEYFNFSADGEVGALGVETQQVQETFFPHL